MSIINKEWVQYEPAKTNRFLIKFEGTDIPSHLFRNYKISNEGDKLILEVESIESVNYTFNPKDFFNIVGVTIDYLDPIGDVHNSLNFNVTSSNYEKIGDYAIDSFTTNKFRFIVDVQIINLTYKNIIDGK